MTGQSFSTCCGCAPKDTASCSSSAPVVSSSPVVRPLVQDTKAKADNLKEVWAHPVKPYGFWNSDKNNHKLLLDMRLSNLSGRQDPYDVALRDK